MGLFQSIPKDVIQNHIVCHLPDYLDRLHLAETCKGFLKGMEKDQLTFSILTKRYPKSLRLVAKSDHYPSFTRLLLIVSQILALDSCLFFETKNKMIIMDMRRLNRKQGDIIQFDRDALVHLYGIYGENIPKKFFPILCSDIGRCAAFAYVGSVKLFEQFLDTDATRELIRNYDLWLLFGETISYEAGLGGHIDMCRIIISDMTWSMSSDDKLVKGLIEQNHKKTLCQLKKEFPDLNNKKQKY